jgi:hypothetical protein
MTSHISWRRIAISLPTATSQFEPVGQGGTGKFENRLLGPTNKFDLILQRDARQSFRTFEPQLFLSFALHKDYLRLARHSGAIQMLVRSFQSTASFSPFHPIFLKLWK